MINRSLNIFVMLAFLAYPVIVYFGLRQLEVIELAIIFFVLAVLRVFVVYNSVAWGLLLISLFILIATLLFRTSVSLKLYPVIVNSVLLVVFLWSLFSPPTVIERIARKTDPNLNESGVCYTRGVTQVWCVFFLCNGMVSLVTVLMSDEVWALYNGLIAYLIMGTLFAAEFIVRRIYKNRQYEKQPSSHSQQ